ncbi:MAG: hypothetical protein RMJ53_05905 [Chitinophagales bacterium]|nr:hypothetical protein [Chitinophagales bacterium]MDW8273745.1 hypothetical protein [Chitinophagales bacterium]
MNIGILHDDLGNHDSAIYYIKVAQKFALENNDTVLLPKISSNLFITLILSKRYEEAMKLYRSETHLLRQKLQEYDKPMAIQIMLNYAKGLVHENKLEEAIKETKLALEISQKHNLKTQELISVNQLAQLYEKKGDCNNAIQYIKKTMELNDSILNFEKTKSIEELNIKYKSHVKDLTISQLNIQRKSDRRLKVGLGFISLLVLTSSFIIYNRQKAKYKLEKELLLKNEELLKAQNELNQSKLNLYEQELSFQKEQLESYTRSVLEKSALIEELKQQLNALPSEKTNPISDEKIQKIKELVESQILTEDQWNEFRKKFDAVHNNFFLKLKNSYPEITNAEMRMAALIKLNMNNKQIASMLGVSDETVYKTKYRLKKRMGIENDTPLEDILKGY